MVAGTAATTRASMARIATVAVATTAGAVVLGGLAGLLVAAGSAAAVLALGLVVVPVGLWKRPHLAPALLIGCALTIEQFARVPASGDTVPLGSPVAVTPPIAPEPLTARIPLFHGMSGLHLAPADLLLVLVGVVYLARARDRVRPRTPAWWAVLAIVAAVGWGTALGVAHHGDIRVALMETRPYVYLAATYLLTTALVVDRRAFRSVLWALVLCIAVKAMQGLLIFVQIRHMNPRPEAVLGHEESFFFALLVFLVLAMWLYDWRGRLRTVATWLLPVVVLADLANNRRAAWLVLGGGLIALAAVALRALPGRRVILWRAAATALVISAVYFPAYWNKTGGLAQPARALRSMVAPNTRDALSDLYRIQENANLKVNIRESDGIGSGFGVPIRYTLPITDISDIDPMIAYIPHNGVLYLLMRMGLAGGVAFWALAAAAIVTGARAARSLDRELAVAGALLVCSVVAYVLMGAVDQAFFFYRIAFVVGTLLGLVDGARPRPVLVAPDRGGRRRSRKGATLTRR